MNNPVYFEYRRSTKLGLLLVLLLSVCGAIIHYLMSIDDKAQHNKTLLMQSASQLNSKLSSVLGFAEALNALAKVKLQLEEVQTTLSLKVLSLTTEELVTQEINNNAELYMLSQLQAYFEMASKTLPLLKNLYYFSEQGFAYNGNAPWPLHQVEPLLTWHKEKMQGLSYEKDLMFYPSLLSNQAIIRAPVYLNDKRIGSFLYIVDVSLLLSDVRQQNALLDFMLLDQSGERVGGTPLTDKDREQHLLQIQRLGNTPWSLAILDKKNKVLALGVRDFFWHWLSYFVLLSVLLLVMQLRYKRRTLSAVNRLIVHINRLASGQPYGVRHIPAGWTDVFDKVYHLNDKKKTESE